ncbi:porin [Brenneria corticis]|nr:porin [Brenneria sp. CFCC 11842]
MMKRNILAVVIPALLAAGAANAAEIYNKDGNKLDLTGKVNGLHYFSDNDGDSGDKTYVRLGFKGETQITSDLTGYGRFEYEFKGNNAESEQTGDKTRYAFVGLKFSDYGSFDYGRNLGIAYDGLAYTDVLPEFGGDSAYTDNLTQRVGGVATYRNTNFFGLVEGLNFGLQYQGKNDENASGRNALGKQNGDGWGTSLEYNTDIGVSVAGSYAKYDRTNRQSADGKGQDADAWATGLKYDANSLYLAATYGQYRNLTYTSTDTYGGFADKTKVFEAVAQYTFDFGLTPSLAYVSAKGKDEQNGINDYVTKYVSVGGTYAFNKNFSTYVDYQINLLDSDNDYGISDDDIVAVGLTYQF